MVETNGTTRISVGTLIGFVLSSGSVDSRFRGSSREVESIRAHQSIQRGYGTGSRAEVGVSYTVRRDAISLLVYGRADGILAGAGGVTIDEIKTTTQNLDEIDETTHPLYWAQARCYAFMWAAENDLPAIGVQLTYYHLDARETKVLRREFTRPELEAFFLDLVDRYLSWAVRVKAWAKKRDESIRHVKFPFAGYRKGQRELAVKVYRAIVEEKNLFAQAPTGIGKTMAALFPAVKAMGEGKLEKIFYLTAKTVTRELAEGAIDRLRGAGLCFKSVTLTAKDKICFKPECECLPERCEFADGHYDRVNGALADLFDHDAFTRPFIEQYARKHRVCPFEFSLDVATWSDAVLCDYNHLFDPTVHLVRFFDGPGGDYAFLIDEAHNLVDRARAMYSAELTKRPFLDLKRLLGKKLPKLGQLVTELNRRFIDLRKQCEAGERGFLVQKEPIADLPPLLRKFFTQAGDWLAKNEPAPFAPLLLDLFFQGREFLLVSELYDERYTTYVETSDHDVRVKQFCLDPSKLLEENLDKGRSAIFFSATLTPLNYFREILGGSEKDETTRTASPFPRENLCLMVEDTIRTTFRARELTYDRVVESIAAVVEGRRGNYLVYLPSYRYQEEIWRRFCDRHPAAEVIRQQPGLTDEQKAAFLARFSVDNTRTLVGFAVMGGVFGEGIDLVGDRLSGCVIVGVGLPQLCLERDQLREYFQETKEMGFEYGYMYPGFSKVLQAAGRVIRTETDRGVVLLIDERFAHPAYEDLFPPEWFPVKRVQGPEQVAQAVNKFWNGI